MRFPLPGSLLLLALSTALVGCQFDRGGLLPPFDAASGDAAWPDVAPLDAAADASAPDAAPDAAVDAQVAVCGDGVLQAGEQCDASDLGGATCTSLGQGTGELTCLPDCTFNLGLCAYCGNGILDSGEPCDGLALGNATCASLGFTAGGLSCAAGCSFDTSRCYTCGDGALGLVEPCDGTDLGSATCASEGFDEGALSCTPGCDLDTSACIVCGDGVAQGAEVCDGTDLLGATCGDLGHDGGALGCTAGCLPDESGCTDCGDGIAQGDEACDDGAGNSDTTPDACRTGCTLPGCGDGVCDTVDRGGQCPADCTVLAFLEDFEGDWPGDWLTGDNDSGNGTDTWGRSSNRSVSSSRSLWCTEDGDNPTGYDEYMQAWAVRAIDLSPWAGSAALTLTLWSWVHTDGDNDWYATTVSPDGGASWTTLASTTGDTGWVQRTYDLTAQAGNASFVLGLYFQSNWIGSLQEGAYVDDIRIDAVW